jgi:hypothetical protein
MSECEICDVLGARVDWGEFVSVEPMPLHPPPEVGRLHCVAEHIFRCPICGRLYERGAASVAFLNNDYDSEYVRRLRPDEYPPSEQAAAQERLRAELNSTEEGVRIAAAKTVAERADSFDDLRTSRFADVRRLATIWLGQMSSYYIKQYRSELQTMLDDADGFVRQRAAAILIRIDPPQDLHRLTESKHPEVRTVATGALTSHLLKERREEAIALLEKSNGEAFVAAVEAFFEAEPDTALPFLERQQKADPQFQVPSGMLPKIGDLLVSGDAETRERAWNILTMMAKRGASVRATLPSFARKLGCTKSALSDIATQMIDSDIDTGPLVRWLSLLAYSDPDEALTFLTDLHERGQSIDGATGILQGLGSKRAKSLLASMQSPQAAERVVQFENLAAGRLMIGGGKAPEWILYAKSDRFFIEYRFGDHGDAQPISAGKVRSILARKAFTWQETR